MSSSQIRSDRPSGIGLGGMRATTENIAIRVKDLSKCYHLYDAPRDRLKQFVVPRAQRLAGQAPKQYFREFWALRDVSFEIKNGEAVGIIGQNGSGKSTLLQIIAGTLQSTHGSVEVNGRVAALLELGSGFNPEFTGRENVYINAAILGLSNEEIDAKFDEIAIFADIGEFIEQPVRTYSSGMMVRLAFAVQSTVEPEILIVDEALAVGDMRFTMKCVRKMRELIDKGTSCLFVSHDMSSIVNFCKDVVWLHDGMIIQKGDPRAITMNYANFMAFGFLPPELETAAHSGDRQRVGLNSHDMAHAGGEGPTRILDNKTEILDGLQWIDLGSLPATGVGGVAVERIAIRNAENRANSLLFVGGEQVDLFLEINCIQPLQLPIISADLRDKKGNLIFGLNTYFIRQTMPRLGPSKRVLLRFSFKFPLLLNGDYSISVAVADGTYESHVLHHIINEALLIKINKPDMPRNHYLVTLESATFDVIPVS